MEALARREGKSMSECEMCLNYVYDDDDEAYVCEADIDEDDMAHMWGGRRRHCPYWRSNDEYRTVKHQSIGHLPGYSDAGYFVDDQKEELSDGEA